MISGCLKCDKEFPRDGFGSKADYSGFDEKTWNLRENQAHRDQANSTRCARTASDKAKEEKEHGARYSELYRLHYYDAIRMVIIDPMHNLLLGSAKHVMKTWHELNILTDEKFIKIQEIVDNMIVPTDMGRIPGRIKTRFAGFTADQWRNWTCYFSLPALKSIIPDKDYKCWQKFVLACTILCSRQISEMDLLKAHGLLKAFCKSFSDIYGKDRCTPNLHLHMHLKDCIQDYGPVYSFWLFSYERYNGTMTSIHSNNRLLSVQLMRKFTVRTQLMGAEWPGEFTAYQDILDADSKGVGALKEMDMRVENDLDSLSSVLSIDEADYTISEHHIPLGKGKQYILEPEERRDCTEMLEKLHPESRVNVLCEVTKYNRLRQGSSTLYAGEDYGSVILAKWYDEDTINGEAQTRPGKITEILLIDVVVTMNGKRKKLSYYIGIIWWYKPHQHRHFCGSPVTIWSTDIEPPSVASFMPLQRVCSKCVVSKQRVMFPDMHETVLHLIPM